MTSKTQALKILLDNTSGIKVNNTFANNFAVVNDALDSQQWKALTDNIQAVCRKSSLDGDTLTCIVEHQGISQVNILDSLAIVANNSRQAQEERF